jgi:hypothetical protein
LIADCHSILASWRNYFSQPLNVHGFDDVRQREIHTEVPLVPETTSFEFEWAIKRVKSHKSPGTDQISAELNKEWGRTIRYEIHKLIISIWNKGKLPEK